MSEQRKYCVYGGCVVRHIFNYLEKEEYNPQVSILHNPIYSLYEKPLGFQQEDFEVEKHAFNRRMLDYDTNKKAIDVIKDSDTDWFICDMISERYTLMKLEYNNVTSIATEQPNFMKNYWNWEKKKTFPNLRKIDDIYAMELDELYEKRIDAFCEMIKQRFTEKRIILVLPRLVPKYVDFDNTIKKFNSTETSRLFFLYNQPEYGNRVIERAVKRVRKNLPNIHIIPFPENVVADARHFLDIHPFHYTDGFYQYAAEAVKVFAMDLERDVEERKVKELCEKASEQYKFLESMLQLPVRYLAYGNIELFNELPAERVYAVGEEARLIVPYDGEECIYQWQYMEREGVWRDSRVDSGKTRTYSFVVNRGHSGLRMRCVIIDKTKKKVLLTNEVQLLLRKK